MNTLKRKPFIFCVFSCIIMVCLAFAAGGLLHQTANAQVASAGTNGLTQQTTSEQAAATDLNFSLYINNGEQEYRVSALSKLLTEAIIPSHYNGLPVTEIADSGFMSCGKLEYVFIPTTIQRVGNNAFMNDAKLKRIVGMPNVTVIGNNAFALCSSLEYLILPGDLSSLGQNVIRNTINPVFARASAEKMALLNPNWNYNGNIVYGNEIVYRDYINDQGVNGYEIAPYQIFEQEDGDLTIVEPLTIYSWCYKNIEDDIGAPLLNIAEGAFAMSTVSSITLKHPEGSALSHSINIESDAFSSIDAEYINIEVDISLNNNAGGESTGVFYGSNFQTITLPDSLDSIPDRMFGACENLTEIRNISPAIETNQLSAKILTIGDDAFNNTKKLPQLYIQDKIKYIGNSTFNQWGTTMDQLLSIDILEEDASNWGTAWRTGIKETGTPKCIVDFTGASSFMLELIVDQAGVSDPVGYSTVQVDRNATLNDITISSPSAISHNFTGIWYTTEGRVPGTEFDVSEPIKKNLTLYAGWEIKSFDIEFPTNKYLDFKDINDNILATNNYHYGEIVRFFISIKDGYKNPTITFNGETLVPNTGNLYTITITGSANFTVSAELIEYTITYANLCDGSNPNTITTYTIESFSINFSNPTWAAYGKGTWDVTSIPSGSIGNKTITAVWSNPVPFTITYANLRGGTNPNTVTTYTIESATINFASPEWEAYDGRTWNITSIPSGSWGNKTISAVWLSPVPFSITYTNLRSGINPNTITFYTVESATINFASPEWEAYNGKTWDITSIPNGSWGNKTISAVWSNPVEFDITYSNLQGGTNPASNPTKFTIDTPTITFINPTWAAYSNGVWDTVRISNGSWGNKTITAIWSNPVVFKINYENLLGGTHSNTVMSYRIDSNTIIFSNPTWAAYNNGTWNATSIPKGSWGDKTISAVWTNPVNFTISYMNVRGGINPSTNPMTYNVETASINFSNPTWAAYNNGAWNITSIPKGSCGNKTVSAVWSNPATFTISYENLLNGTNSSSNPTTYTIETPTITFAGASRPGYPYSSWDQSSIPTGSLGNKIVRAVWGSPIEYIIKFVDNEADSSLTSYKKLQYDSNFQNVNIGYSFKTGNIFKGYYTEPKGKGEKYYEPSGEYQKYNNLASCTTNKMTGDITLYSHYERFEFDLYVYWEDYNPNLVEVFRITYFSDYMNLNATKNKDGHTFLRWQIKYDDVIRYTPDGVLELNCGGFGKISADGNYPTVKAVTVTAMYEANCVTGDTLITLADGTQKPVDQLTGNEMLLVWNLHTGKFDTAPILFIDSDPARIYEVINLYFSDGTTVKVISEHAFWDIDLNRYVYLRKDATQYIGHWFNKQSTDANGNMTWAAVQLTNVVVANEVTTAWSPVTAEHLCYYVNGMLSMPGGITGLFNIFEVNSETMQYDQAAMQADIEEYGLFTYEEFAELVPVSQEIFDAFDAQYFKVAIGKGLITMEDILALVETYSEFFTAI